VILGPFAEVVAAQRTETRRIGPAAQDSGGDRSGRREPSRTVAVVTTGCVRNTPECRATRPLQSRLDPDLQARGDDLRPLVDESRVELSAFLCPCNQAACLSADFVWIDRVRPGAPFMRVMMQNSDKALQYLRDRTQDGAVEFRIQWSAARDGSNPLASENVVAFREGGGRVPSSACR
jgi:hypothetical protein